MAKRKPKVYIPTYKIIITCGIVIVVCISLLLITNIHSINESKRKENIAITQRFDSDNTTSATNKNAVTEKKDTKKEVKKENKSLAEEVRPTEKKIEPAKPAASTTKPAAKTTTTSTNKNTTATTKPASTEKPTTAEKPVATAKPAANTTAKPAEKPVSKPVEPAKSVSTTAATTVTTMTEPAKTVVQEQKKDQSTSIKDFGFPKAQNNAQLVFVFDDGGQNLNHLEKFMDLPFPITIAVLPRLAHSKESADRIRKSGNELILHQPMQALNAKTNPGPGALTPSMTEDEIITTLFQNINEIGPIAGMNNHEGSAITADAEKMSVVMKTAAENGIYFLDSRTNVDTKVSYVAEAMGYSYYERNVFLDNTKNRNDILKEINKGITLANKNGVVIMIGHIWSADVLPGILKEIYPELKQKGYTFATVSKSKAKK